MNNLAFGPRPHHLTVSLFFPFSLLPYYWISRRGNFLWQKQGLLHH